MEYIKRILDEIYMSNKYNVLDIKHFNLLVKELNLENITPEKLMEIYNYSEELFNKFIDILNNEDGKYYNIINYEIQEIKKELLKNIEETEDLSTIDNLLDDFLRKAIINSDSRYIDKNKYSQEFIDKNKDLFLIDIDIPEEVKERYLKRELTDIDIFTYAEKLDFVPIELFTRLGPSYLGRLKDSYGVGNLQKLIKKHKDVFQYFVYEHPEDILELEAKPNEESLDYETIFENAMKRYCRKFIFPDYVKDGKHYLPKLMDSMNFELIENYENIEQLKTYTNKTFIVNAYQEEAIETLKIENILKLEEKTKFFSYNQYDKMINLELLGEFLIDYDYYKKNLKFLNYDEFEEFFANCLDVMRANEYFINVPDYNFIKGEFREKYPYLFMDEKAPQELYSAFFNHTISYKLLQGQPDYIQFLLDKNLKDIILDKTRIVVHNDFQGRTNDKLLDFYIRRFGNKEMLNLICKYGELLNTLTNSYFYINERKKEIDDYIKEKIYNEITSNYRVKYKFLNEENRVKEFVEEYPDIFIEYESIPQLDDNEENDKKLKEEIYNKFYNKEITFKLIYQYPQLIDYFKDKNVRILFGIYFVNDKDNFYDIASLISRTDKDVLFELCKTYGKYLEYLNRECVDNIVKFDNLEDKKRTIEDFLSKEFILGRIDYAPINCPKFLKEKHPELFLDKDAPESLYTTFYNIEEGDNLSFKKLYENKHWLKYLENKSAITGFLRNLKVNSPRYEQMKLYFESLGQDKALKLGINKPEIINKMIKEEQAEKVKIWYESTGEKFIPDYVVMQSFPIDQIDKFLKASKIWSKLMKVERYSNHEEGRDTLLKIAYVFGVFDNDQKGINQLLELINGVPKTIPFDSISNMRIIDRQLYRYRYEMDKFKVYNGEEYNLLITLKEEGLEINAEEGMMSRIYIQKENDNENLYLNINPQKYPKSSRVLRTLLETIEATELLNPKKAHQLFGGFDFIYDKDFKEFLIENIDEILFNPDYTNKIANIQKQFNDIKIANSNRKLTLNLAISYIRQNQYTSVEVGNEEVAEISAIAGYSQSDFDTLQLIYNFGKQRVFSSIPRIKSQQDKYNYEILRLDDPLALAIGTLTDCCQEIGNIAEMCVEHSMVDKNGRVFVIKDDVGNIISQSWVWRNKNVLCFDNIEIPDKAFTRISNTKEFTTEVYNIYKKAAQELIEIDEQKYKELLEEGKITKEQYEGLKLSKVTVGLGYNDIADSINENATKDLNPKSPLGFTPPIKLAHSLYTNDSRTQYILEKTTTSNPYNGHTLSLYNDEIKVYTKDNFKEKELLRLKKLEIETKESPYNLVTDLYNENQNLISELADNCELDEEKTKVIMTPNYAIIYEEDEDIIKIGEIFYNTEVNSQNNTIDITEKVLLQLKLALEEITKDKRVDIELLDDNQKKFYLKAMKLNEQLDIERGINNARKNK